MGVETEGWPTGADELNEVHQNDGKGEVKLPEEEAANVLVEADQRQEDLTQARIESGREREQLRVLDLILDDAFQKLIAVTTGLDRASQESNSSALPESINAQVKEASALIADLKQKMSDIAKAISTESKANDEHYGTVSAEYGQSQLGRPRPSEENSEAA